jgi:hypothetical protein
MKFNSLCPIPAILEIQEENRLKSSSSSSIQNFQRAIQKIKEGVKRLKEEILSPVCFVLSASAPFFEAAVPTVQLAYSLGRNTQQANQNA